VIGREEERGHVLAEARGVRGVVSQLALIPRLLPQIMSRHRPLQL
jgi:hypothetical protein